MPIGFVHTWWYHLNNVGSKLYVSLVPIQIHSNGFDDPLIQTRFCICTCSCTTIWKDPNKVLYLADLHVPFKSIQMVLEGPLIHHLEVSKQG